MKPLCIDLFAGLGGFSEAFLAEGYRCVGFDIERHQYERVVKNGDGTTGTIVDRYPGQLVLQDVLTIHGSQFKDATIIVASSPCQAYSWLAMPWSRSPDIVRPDGDGWEVLNSTAAKELRRKWEREGPDNRLFDACARIQREACYAKRLELGCCELDYQKPACPRCHIPMIQENVRGAQPWVGKAVWNFGSFFLWGDVPALMPIGRPKAKRAMDDLKYGQRKLLHEHLPVGTGPLGRNAEGEGVKVASETGRRTRDCGIEADGTKIGGDWFSDHSSTCRKHGSKSSGRKAASAQIAKIPYILAEHIARVFKPR